MKLTIFGILSITAIFVAAFIFYQSSVFSTSTSATEIVFEDPVLIEIPENITQNPLHKSAKITVIVELFTSEGCSSCPPADYVLNRLEESQPVQDVEVITLGQHVDYWNRLGWKDEFSAPLFSERQNRYAQTFGSDQVYTPQMIVDGKTEFVGSNMQKAQTAIIESAKQPKATVELSFADEKQNSLNVKITDLPKFSGNAEVFLALTEDNIISNVRSGENAGKTLPHRAVVRELRSFATLLNTQKEFTGNVTFQTQTSWKRQDLRAIVFIQETGGKIIGANRINLP